MESKGIRLIRFRHGSQVYWGRLASDQIEVIPGQADSFSGVLGVVQARAEKRFSLNQVEILSPVTAPCNIFCQGKNYFDHIVETGFRPQDKSFNLFFSKSSSALISAKGKVIRPQGVRLLDYELELGLVIGKPIERSTQITPDNIHEYVAGLVMANDVSARDIQVPQGQWFKGKSFRTFCPVGPFIYLMDRQDFSHLENLDLLLSVNGQVRQKANTKNMIYKPSETLTELSGVVDLMPGDLVLTGTPSGVAMRVKQNWKTRLAKAWFAEPVLMNKFVETQAQSPRYLKNGDVIRSSIRSSDGAIDLGEQELTIV